jgi:hypothetical protein
LSVEAVQDKVMDVVDAAPPVSPLGAVGALVSAQADVEAEVDERVERLPPLSYASTASR